MHHKCIEILNELKEQKKIKIWRTFEFPQAQPLKLRLKDMLEDSPNEKYYLKKEIQDKFVMKDSSQDNIVSCAMRGRYTENGNVEQQIELNSEQVANCITTAQKDSMVMENKEPKIDRIGGMYGQATRWGVYNKEGICPTIVASMGEGGGHVPMIETEAQIEEVGKLDTKAFECCRRVYGTERISPTVTAMGGDHVHKIVEPINTEKDGTAHTIKSQYAKTSVANFTREGTFAATGVVERLSKQAYETLEENDCKDGDIINPFNKKVEKSGICPTITTRPEGMKTANLVVVGNSKKANGEIINPLKGKTENGWLFEQQVYDPKGIARTIKAGGGSGNIPKVVVDNSCYPIRIRKLTPRECWKLQGWTDEQFDKIKGISNAQLYKQAGNGITVTVLEAIFRQMFLVKYDKKDTSITGKQLELF